VIPETVRCVLASGTPYVAPMGGANKANRRLAEGLAADGHSVHVVCIARRAMKEGEGLGQFLDDLNERGITPRTVDGLSWEFELAGVHVHAASDMFNIRQVLGRLLTAVRPAAILVSSEDWRQMLLGVATDYDATRVIYQGRTITSFPFGPYAAEPSREATEQLRRVRAIATPCAFYAEYVERWLGRTACVIYNDFRSLVRSEILGSWDNEFVSMINPCALKGISIFLGLARLMPDTAFAAVPLWGTSRDDLTALGEQPNVTLLQPTEKIEEIYRRTRVLLVPSLWPEGISNAAVEASAHGIPVMASDIGGLREITPGDGIILPIRPIESFEHRGGLPRALSQPEQDLAPWHAALSGLLSDRTRYEAAAARSRAFAVAFVSRTGTRGYEEVIASVAGRA
jgi:glycosyltransferase involved in cell wall biosynthesis